MKIQKLIDSGFVFIDGGMGTQLQEKGLRAGEIPEEWNIINSQIIEDVHRAYFEAGADIQFVLVGSGDPALENWYNALAARFPGKFVFYCGYAPDKISHLVEAGADFFVMPSRYEPCGLNQMYSMRYGTLPIVRATGGLADTVTNFNYQNVDEATGFVFYDLHADSLAATMRWAADVRAKETAAFEAMRVNAMKKDLSWNNTAAQYERMYEDAHK